MGLALLAFLPGCSKKSPEPHAQPLVVAPQAPSATSAAASAEATPPAVVHGSRKLKNLDVPVFVDGAQVAVLRFGELASQLAPVENPAGGTNDKHFYRLYEYLKSVGVDAERVKAVHFAGNRDVIASLEGSELRAEKSRFVFDFLERDTGIAKLDWDTTGLKNLTRIDEIYAVNVFVNSAVSVIDAKKHCYLDASDDTCTPVARFTANELAKGTRVYVDGKMVAYVKRRLLPAGLTVGKTSEGDDTFSVDKYLTSLGLDAAASRGVELVAGDSVVGRARGGAWAKDRAAIVFTMPKHSHGKVRVVIPADLQARGDDVKEGDVTVTAIKLYRTTTPSDRALTALDEVVDVGPLPATDQQQAALAGGRAHERDNE